MPSSGPSQVPKEKLLSTRQAAVAAKDDFVERYIAGHTDRSAGIGLNQSGDDWAVKVFVGTPSAAAGIPARFHDLAVEVQVVGAAHALER